MLDLVIKNAKSISVDKFEIGIKNKKIVEIAKNINSPSRNVYTLKDDEYISYGWIDSHVHCYEKMNLYYDYPDEIGIQKGVATVIDAGTTGENNITKFYELSKKCKTNVYALLNISKDGIIEQNELADLSKIDEKKNILRIRELEDFIIGIKVRMSKTVVGENGIMPLKMGKQLQMKVHIPLMVHIGSAPPELSEILDLLEKGDIVTHCYNGKSNGIMDKNGKIKDFVWSAYNKGINLDIGHGTDSFNFIVAREAIDEGLICKTISTDIYYRNRENGPVYDLATTLEKALSIGISMENAIKMITENPAEIFKLKNKGKIEIGYDADFTIFSIENKEKELLDSNCNKRFVNKIINPKTTIVGGDVYKINQEV